RAVRVRVPGVQPAHAVVDGRSVRRVLAAVRLDVHTARGPRLAALGTGQALGAGLTDHDPRAQAVERPGDEGGVGHGRTATGWAVAGAGTGTGAGAGRATASTTMRREGPQTMGPMIRRLGPQSNLHRRSVGVRARRRSPRGLAPSREMAIDTRV